MTFEEAHSRSLRNQKVIQSSELCGCFCCLSTYPSKEVTEFVRVDETAICPRCGVDAVLGDQSGCSLTQSFLREMQVRWFNEKTSSL